MVKSFKATRPRVVLVNRCIIEDSKGKVLLLQRAKGDHWGAGLWEFPGGKLDVGQDITHALEREVLEETQLAIITTSRVCFVDGEMMTSGKYSGLPYVVIFGLAKLVGGSIKLSSEHDNHKWLTPTQALKLHLTSESLKALANLYPNR